MARKKPQCEFRAPSKLRCLNDVYEGTLCKRHMADSTLPSGKIKPKDMGIYVDGLHKYEQDIYEDVTTGTLLHEIKIAKLQLRRLLIKQRLFNESPEDVNKMIATNINMKDVVIQNGKLITTSGLPVDLLDPLSKTIPLSGDVMQVIPASLIDTNLQMTRPDYATDIERMLKIITVLERSHFEMMGGNAEDADFIAKQIHEALGKIDDNAEGVGYESD